jgi:7-carboxy-7-deazaguanine synthase
MTYPVKEIFYSLQGEGRHAGQPAVFCRFAGCNLWSGRERDRATAACTFCDTDFVGVDGEGGGRFDESRSLAKAIGQMWGDGLQQRFVVLTGGEPLLQVDDNFLSALHELGFELALETNGSLRASSGIDWITVSPKGSTVLVQTTGNELKMVFPQKGVDPAKSEALPSIIFCFSRSMTRIVNRTRQLLQLMASSIRAGVYLYRHTSSRAFADCSATGRRGDMSNATVLCSGRRIQPCEAAQNAAGEIYIPFCRAGVGESRPMGAAYLLKVWDGHAERRTLTYFGG